MKGTIIILLIGEMVFFPLERGVAAGGSDSSTLPSFQNVNEFIQKFLPSFSDFVQSGTRLTGESTVRPTEPTQRSGSWVFDWFRQWIDGVSQQLTGFTLTQIANVAVHIIKSIGNLIVRILTLITNALSHLLSFI